MRRLVLYIVCPHVELCVEPLHEVCHEIFKVVLGYHTVSGHRSKCVLNAFMRSVSTIYCLSGEPSRRAEVVAGILSVTSVFEDSRSGSRTPRRKQNWTVPPGLEMV